MSATTSNAASIPVSLDEMTRAMREIDLIPQLDWVLITPDGRMFKGTQRDVARVLFQNLDVTSLFKDQP